MEDFVASMLIKLEQFPCVLINNGIFTIIWTTLMIPILIVMLKVDVS